LGGVAAGCALGFVATTAHGQWMRSPTPDDLAAAYPAAAKEAGVTGRADLSCVVAGDGSLDACTIALETPSDRGFGAAALSLRPLFKMDMASAMGSAAKGKRLRLPVRFGMRTDAPPLRAATFKNAGSYAWLSPAGPYWPDRALRMGRGGFVQVDCAVGDDQRLRNCVVIQAEGEDVGFVDSVLRMTQQAWMTAGPLPPNVAIPADGVWRFEVTFDAKAHPWVKP
jgi:TonB family protein